MTGGAQSLRPEPLTRAGFAAFGDVIEAADAFDVINSGTTRQYRKLTEIEVSADGGRTQVSLYRVVPYELPLAIAMLERHPLSSQLFMPLSAAPFLVVVAPPGENVDRSERARVRDQWGAGGQLPPRHLASPGDCARKPQRVPGGRSCRPWCQLR